VTEFVGGKLGETAEQTYTLKLVAKTFLAGRTAVFLYKDKGRRSVGDAVLFRRRYFCYLWGVTKITLKSLKINIRKSSADKVQRNL
jgi:hypothetical protein